MDFNTAAKFRNTEKVTKIVLEYFVGSVGGLDSTWENTKGPVSKLKQAKWTEGGQKVFQRATFFEFA